MYGTPQELQAVQQQSAQGRAAFAQKYGEEQQQQPTAPVSTASTPQDDQSRIMGILNQNSDKNFVQRILKPEGKPTLDLGKGNFATHKMAWSTVDGKPIVYPTVVQDKNTGKLKELSSKDAVQHALKNNEFIPMKDGKDAEWFSSNYKKVWSIDGKNITMKQGATTPEQTISDPDLAAAAEEGKEVRDSFIQRYGGEDQPTAATSPDDQHDASDKQSMAGSLMLGGHMGMMELAARAVQGGAKLGEITGYMPKGTADEFRKQFNKKYLQDPQFLAALKQHRIAARTGELVGGTVPLLPATELLPVGAAAAGAGKLASGIGGRAIGGALAGLTQYDPTGKESAQQAGIGALANVILPAVGGKVVKGLGAGVKAITPAVKKAAEKYGVKLSPFPRMERALTALPGSGVGEVIAARGAKVAQAGKAIARKIIDEAGGKAEVSENGVEHGYAKHFTDAMKRSYFASKMTVGRLKTYLGDVADKITAKTGLTVNPVGMNVAAKEGVRNLKELPEKFQDVPLMKSIMKHSSPILGKPSGIVTAEGVPFPGRKGMSYRGAIELRKQIDDKISSLGTKITGVQKNVRRLYISIRSGLADDINKFADDAGKDFKSIHAAADNLYAQKVAPFDKPPYSKMLTGDMNSGQFISKFIKPVKEVAGGEEPEDINKLLSLMPKNNARAKLAMRAAMTSRALEVADLPGGGINGKKYADEMMKLMKTSGGVFNKAQKDTVKGYQILTHHLEKYQPKVTDTSKIKGMTLPKGLAYGGGFGAAMFHPWLTGAAYASGIGISKLFTTSGGQKLLRSVATLGAKAGDVRLNSFIRRGLQLITAKEAVKAGRG